MPLAKWLRWRLVCQSIGTWGATFRVRVSPSRQSFFNPSQLPGCALWLRSDLGVELVGGSVAFWADQSPAGDSNRSLNNFNGNATNPGYTPTSSAFNDKPTLNFSSVNSTFMTSVGAWVPELLQPTTWIYVVSYTGGGAGEYLQDSDDVSTGQKINYTNTGLLTISANAGSVTYATGWTSTNALLGEWDGSSSKIYFNNFTTPVATGTVRTGMAGGQGSMTLGEISNQSGALAATGTDRLPRSSRTPASSLPPRRPSSGHT